MRYLFLVLTFAFCAFANGQNCGTDIYHRSCLENNSSYRNGYLKNERHLKSNNANNNRAPIAGPYTIPVVVHILHLGENSTSNTSMTESVIKEGIEDLNDYFAGLGVPLSGESTNTPPAIDMEINFCLASIDPQGNPTSGIVRVDGSVVPNYETEGLNYVFDESFGANGQALRDLSVWSPYDYLNIWVVHKINGAGAFASYPNGSLNDGVTMKSSNYNTPILAHEVGHWFNLFHTFADDNIFGDIHCPENDDCTTQGDRVCDTPPHKSVDCFNSDCASTPDLFISTYNFMSYCSQTRSRFTLGQKDRMHEAIIGPIRGQLLESVGCANSAPSNNANLVSIKANNPIICGSEYTPKVNVKNQGTNQLTSFTVRYKINNGDFQSQVVSSNLSFGESENFLLNSIETEDGDNHFFIELTHANNQVDEINTYDKLNITFPIDLNTATISPEFFEDLESFNQDNSIRLPPGFNSYNADNELGSGWGLKYNSLNTWIQGTSSNNETNTITDILRLPIIDLTSQATAKFVFDYAFGFSNNNPFDPTGYSAEVVIKETCNDQGDILWTKSDNDLTTYTEIGIGSPANFKPVIIDLDAYLGKQITIEIHYCVPPSSTTYSFGVDNFLIKSNNNCPLSIDPSMIYNQDGTLAGTNGFGGSLFDEQDTMGEPAYNLGAKVNSDWSLPNMNDQIVYVDLGQAYNISDIYLYDSFGDGQFKISPGLPLENSAPVIDVNLNVWPTAWRSFEQLNFTSRYISFYRETSSAKVGEIYICGTPVDNDCSDFTITNNYLLNPLCNNEASGSISINVNSGTPPFNFNWEDGSNMQNRQNLTSGIYSVTVQDANMCTATKVFELINPLALQVDLESNSPTCQNIASGSITPNIQGGTPSYSFLWSNNTNLQNLQNLQAGDYSLTLTDANSCTQVASTSLALEGQLAVSLSKMDVSIAGENDGSATATVLVGQAPFIYKWSNGQQGNTINNLAPGDYSVTVSDNNQCIGIASFEILEGSENPCNAIVASINIAHNECSLTNATASVNVENAIGNLSYNWNTGNTSSTINTLSPGIFSVTVIDENNCSVEASIFVSDPNTLNIQDLQTTPIVCDLSGSIDFGVSGGTFPYTILINEQNLSLPAEINTPGIYEVSITDGNGCTAETILEIEDIFYDVETEEPEEYINCFPFDNFSISVNTGGNSISWDNGGSTATLTDLSEGTYGYTLTDVNGCTGSSSISVFQPTPIDLNLVIENATSESNGSANAIVNNSNTLFLWSTGETGSSINNLSAGDYSVTVSDQNGCLVIEQFTIGGTVSSNNTSFESEFIIAPNPATEELTVSVLMENYADYEIAIIDILGIQHSTIIGSGHSNIYKLNISDLNPGVYFCTLKNKKEVKIIEFVKMK